MTMIFPQKTEDPTPEEIAERAAEVRKDWTPEIFEKRARWAHARVKTLVISERFFDSFGQELPE